MEQPAAGNTLSADKVFCLLAAYFLAHMAVRVAISGSLELDEAEQLVLSQSLSWGYGTKPPLYSWLQIGFFRLFGESVLALALLKNLLLFGTYFCTFLAARRLTEREDTALISTLSLLMIPQIVWESQRDLTHSVLATALAALILYLFLRLCEERSAPLYMAFGIAVGLGLLAKANCAILPAALVIAGLSLPGVRPVLLDRRSLLSLAAILVTTGGYLAWFAANSDAALAQAGTFHIKKTRPYWQTLLSGNGRLLKSTVAFCGTAVILLLAIFRRKGQPCTADSPQTQQHHQLLGRTLLVTLLILELMVILFKVTNIKARWLQPILFYAPVLLACCLAARPDRAAMRTFCSVCLAISLIVLLLLPAGTLLAAPRDKFDAFNIPYQRFAEQLRQRGFDRGVIIAENGLIAGNLRLHLPGSTVVAAGLPKPELPTTDSCMVVWGATDYPNPPLTLLGLAENLQFAADRKQAQILEAPYYYGGTPPQMAKLGIIPCQPNPAVRRQ